MSEFLTTSNGVSAPRYYIKRSDRFQRVSESDFEEAVRLERIRGANYCNSFGETRGGVRRSYFTYTPKG